MEYKIIRIKMSKAEIMTNQLNAHTKHGWRVDQMTMDSEELVFLLKPAT